MKVVLVQLSDIHLDDQRDNPILSKAGAIAEATFSHLVGAEKIYLLISGDIAQSGKKSQYAIAREFVNRIKTGIATEAKCEVEVVMAPGNHDCDFDLDSSVRRGSVRLVEEDGVSVADDELIRSCTSIQEDYFSFNSEFEAEGWEGDQLRRTKLVHVGDKTLSFEVLNISWVSRMKEMPGKLLFPFRRYEQQKMKSDVNVVMMHHPFNWFNQSIYRDFRAFIRSRATLIITGHEHQSGISEVDELESGKSIALEGCVLQHSRGLDHTGFNVISLDLLNQRYQVNHYGFERDVYKTQGMGAWTDYRPLPEKRDLKFQLRLDFRALMEDPGVYLSVKTKPELKLSDIYVYPDLRPLKEVSGRRKFLSSSTLLTSESLDAGVLLQGEEKGGATSLLYQLYRHYNERDYIPLYIRGTDVRRSTSDEIESIIRKAVFAQYGDESVAEFGRTSGQRKICFLDDFDDCPVKSDAGRAEVLKLLKARFGRIVIAVGPLFEIKEIASQGVLDEVLDSFDRYQLQPFGSVKRSQLIRRWFELNRDNEDDDAAFLGKCDSAEKLMNGVMNKSLIPHIPLHMLTLLESVEAGRSGELKDSALGHYYQFLLTSALQRAGVKRDRLNQYYQYCAHLAWEFHTEGGGPLDRAALVDFNDRYSKNWHTVDLQVTLDILESAKVLVKRDSFYSFRYPYIYYFLKGYYVNMYIDEEGMRDYVVECCAHLYVRDNANTMLFLAHHASGDFVVRQISSTLKSIFEEYSPVELNADTGSITRLISDAPRLSYEGGTPEEHREKRDRVDDENDDGRDGLLDARESGESLSLAAKLATLTKTSEILGQVLKDQFSKIPRSRKEELIKEIFDGSLRAMSDFFQFMNSNSEKIVNSLRVQMAKEGRSEKTEENNSAARTWVANLVQGVTFGMIMRAAQNTGSDDLREDLGAVVKRGGTTAYKMIELATYLDTARSIPRHLVEKAYLDSEGNIVVRQLLMFLVLNRLYMFKTSEGDMKWLASKLNIKMGLQKSLAYHRDDMKKV